MFSTKEEVKYFNKTLNLPKTTFSMKANLPKVEENILNYWSIINLYDLLKKKREVESTFILNDGPPYANGSIHIGHGLNKVLKDITNKVAVFYGKCVLFVPGWDCHGLPIELAVEKRLGKPFTKEEKQIFRRNCRKYAEEQIKIQKKEFIRLGILADWSNYYSTMDFSFEANILKAFKFLFNNNFLVKNSKPVYWCFDCKSTLADAEVLYVNKISNSLFVNFCLIDYFLFLKKFNLTSLNFSSVFFVVWTTTPWTLLFNEAVALNDSFYYTVFTRNNESLFVIASVLLKNFIKLTDIKEIKIVTEVIGFDLVEFFLRSPCRNYNVPIVSSDHVKGNSGTGFVHIAPAYGYDDFLISKKYNLPCLTEINEEGVYSGNEVDYLGKTINDLDLIVLTNLHINNFIFLKTSIEHSYPHCWRHKTPIIYRATSQWFINLENNNLVEKSLDALSKIDCEIPKWSKQSFINILKNRPDWCISRQRVWGVPIPLYLHKKTELLHPKTDVLLEKAISIVKENGVEGWYTFLEEIKKEKDFFEYNLNKNDVLDVWFDSSVVHYCVLDNNCFGLRSPADLCIEGVDQYRGWFQASLLTSIALKNKVPYKKMIAHGFVLDSFGVKLSKSSVNKVSPDNIINMYGADVFRLWVSSVDFTVDVTLSEEILERLCDSYRKMRNTLRFVVANLYDFSYEHDLVSVEKLVFIDFWLLQKLFNLQKVVLHNFENYAYNVVYQELKIFCISTLSSFYFDIAKDRLYTSGTKSLVRKSAQTVLYYILKVLLQLMAPVLSFTAEEVWLHCGENLNLNFSKTESVFLQTWYDNPLKDVSIRQEDAIFWEYFLKLRFFVTKLLSFFIKKKFIRSTLDSELFLYCGTQLYHRFLPYVKEFHFALLVSRVRIFKLVNIDIQSVKADTDNLFFIKVKKVKYLKCLRCWQRVLCANLYSHKICNRCIKNTVDPNIGEFRLYF